MAIELTSKQIKLLPKYVRLNFKSGPCLRLHNPEYNAFPGWRNNLVEYYRDAGAWSMNFRLDEKTKMVYSVFPEDHHLHDIHLVPVTKAEWRKDNRPHLFKDSKAYEI